MPEFKLIQLQSVCVLLPLWLSLRPRLFGLIDYFYCLLFQRGICKRGLLLVPLHWVLKRLSFLYPFWLHFAAPNWMWYLFATWFVILSIFCSSSRSCIRQTPPIHYSESRLKFCLDANPRFLFFGSLTISSIRVVYSITDTGVVFAHAVYSIIIIYCHFVQMVYIPWCRFVHVVLKNDHHGCHFRFAHLILPHSDNEWYVCLVIFLALSQWVSFCTVDPFTNMV